MTLLFSILYWPKLLATSRPPQPPTKHQYPSTQFTRLDPQTTPWEGMVLDYPMPLDRRNRLAHFESAGRSPCRKSREGYLHLGKAQGISVIRMTNGRSCHGEEAGKATTSPCQTGTHF